MSITSVGNRGFGTSTTSGTVLQMNVNLAVTSGDYVFLLISSDNVTTTDGDNNEVASVSDAQQNIWVKQGEYVNGTPGAGLGVVNDLWISKVGTMGLNDLITVTFTGNRTDKCCALWQFSLGAGNVLTQDAPSVSNEVNGAVDFGSVSISNLNNQEHLFIRSLSKKANSSTGITVSSGFTRIPTTRSQNAASAVLVCGEFEIATTTNATSNPALAVVGNTAGQFYVYSEQGPWLLVKN